MACFFIPRCSLKGIRVLNFDKVHFTNFFLCTSGFLYPLEERLEMQSNATRENGNGLTLIPTIQNSQIHSAYLDRATAT